MRNFDAYWKRSVSVYAVGAGKKESCISGMGKFGKSLVEARVLADKPESFMGLEGKARTHAGGQNR